MSSSDDPELTTRYTWINDLKPLREHVSWLKSLAESPVSTLQTTVKTIIGVWIVGGILDITREILDAILAVWDALTVLPETTADLLTDGGSAIGDPLLDALALVNAELVSAAASLGPLAPVALALVYVVSALLVIRALRAALPAIIQSMEVVPVVGPALSAVAEFVYQFIGGNS